MAAGSQRAPGAMREDSVSVCRGCGLQQNLSEKWWQDLQLGMGSLTLGEKGWDGMGWEGAWEGNGTKAGSAGGDERALG